jgi:uncharacterized protein (TIGR03067 family)
MLAVILIAGSIAMFRTSPVQPVAGTTPRSDQERIQGRWQAVEVVSSKTTKKKALSQDLVWTFHGTHLTIHRSGNAGEESDQRGSFSLSTGAERKLFDFTGTRPDGTPIEPLGIYEFDGEYLKLCYWVRLDPNDVDFKRPDSFAVEPGTRRVYTKFRRLGE